MSRIFRSAPGDRQRAVGEAQIAFILCQGEEGTAVGEICRKAGISEATYYNWRKKYGGLMPSEIDRAAGLRAGPRGQRAQAARAHGFPRRGALCVAAPRPGDYEQAAQGASNDVETFVTSLLQS